MKAIQTHALSRGFGDILAVDGLDLEVPAGTITGFLGPNGAGKTTTIRLLLGLLRPDAGTVHLFGKPVRSGDSAPLRGIGALIEQPSLYAHLSGAQNLELTRRYLGLDRQRVEHCLRLVDLDDAAHRAVGGYSLGMKQRLGLALAMLGEPRLLILDEPTNGLDPAGIHEIRRLIRSLAAETGVTIFLSSHLLSEIEHVAARVTVIQQGRLLYQGSTDGLRTLQQSTITVGVDNIEAARRVLVDAGLEVVGGEGQYLHIQGNGAALRRRIAALLVAAGVGLEHLNETRPSLEQAFLDLVAQQEHVAQQEGEAC